MPWTYIQATGHMYYPGTGGLMASGYSGNTIGYNDPAMQNKVGVGPIPVGFYTIGPPHMPINHLGPLALPLIPDKGNHMFGRSGFFIHGDSLADPGGHSASNGCIIMARIYRREIWDSIDKVLHVVAKDADRS